jgi:hypothetical protein
VFAVNLGTEPGFVISMFVETQRFSCRSGRNHGALPRKRGSAPRLRLISTLAFLLRERSRLKRAKTVNRALLDSKKSDVNDCSMKGHLLFLATVLGLGALIFLAGCAENSGWDTGFMGAPMNSNATPSDSYR